LQLKKILLIAFVCLNLKTFGQDMIYLVNGNSVPAKIIEIRNDSVKFKNLANPSEPIFSYPATDLKFAFNVAGNYLIFNPAKPFTDKEKDEFISSGTKYHAFDIVVELSGKPLVFNIAYETEAEISDGKEIKLDKNSLAFVIRKNGNHELFCAVDKATPLLVKCKLKIDSSIAHQSEIPPFTLIPNKNGYIVPDMQLIGRKAIENVQELTEYLLAINSGRTERYFVDRIMGTNRTQLFLNYGTDTRVEASNIKTGAKKVYKLRDYLERLVKKTGQFDKLTIAYADINYATKFRRGPDGNYYATITFDQKIQGFIDGNVVYLNPIKKNMEFVLPPHRWTKSESRSTVWLDYIF